MSGIAIDSPPSLPFSSQFFLFLLPLAPAGSSSIIRQCWVDCLNIRHDIRMLSMTVKYHLCSEADISWLFIIGHCEFESSQCSFSVLHFYELAIHLLCCTALKVYLLCDCISCGGFCWVGFCAIPSNTFWYLIWRNKNWSHEDIKTNDKLILDYVTEVR